MKIPVYRPSLSGKELNAFKRVLESGWFTQGQEVASFEKEFCEFTEAPHAAAVSNCTAALTLALKAVGVQPGTEVITASHSFIATANSIRVLGAIPVFVDVDPNTFNLNPDQVERSINQKTSAVLVVHQMGMPCDLSRLLKLTQKRKIPLIEDAACAVGSEFQWDQTWKKIGFPIGDVVCFSFHPRKLLTTGEGGMITTRSEELAKKIRILRHHGMAISDLDRHQSKKFVIEQYEDCGFNFRMSDFQAAMGREQLRMLPKWVRRRRERAARYFEALSQLKSKGFRLPEEPPFARSNWQSFCLRLPDSVRSLEVLQKALDQGIGFRRGIMCAHREPAYLNSPNSWKIGAGCSEGLRESEQAQDHCVLLPLFDEMNDQEQDEVISFLKSIN